MSTVSAYAATSATEPLTKTTIDRRDPGPHDVAIDIKFAGICHSDIHTAKGEWGQPNYPIVPGHEIAGVVTEVGSEVTRHKVGDHVGVGCMVDSCRECSSCQAGLEQYCERGTTFTYNSIDKDGHVDAGRLQPGHRRRRELRRTHPRLAAAGQGGAAAVRRRHAVLAAAALEGRREHPPGDHRPGRAGAHGRQAGRRDGRRGDGAVAVAEEDGGRTSAGRQATTTRPPTRTPSAICAAAST